jgi:hypothetical protein
MKMKIAGAVALGLSLAQFAVAPVLAAETAVEAAQFRAPAPQAFTSEDLQRYGLAEADADRAMAYQDEGYEIRVLTPEEAEAYQAGFTDQEWLLIGILAAVIVIAVAVAD